MVDKIFSQASFPLELVAWKMPANAIVDAKPNNYRAEGRNFALQFAAQLNAPLSLDSPATDTLLAHIATKAAKSFGKEFDYSRAVFEQKWVKSSDISNEKLLIELAVQIGLQPDKFTAAFFDEANKQAVLNDFQRASNERIWTIPAYMSEGVTRQVHHFRELPSLELLRKFIELGVPF